MAKTKKKIKEISNRIIADTGKYLFTKTELGKLTGLCRNVITDMCKNVPSASTGKRDLYYIDDFLEKLFNG